MCVCVSVCLSVHLCVCLFLSACLCVYLCGYVGVVCVGVCMCVCVVCVFVCVCVSLCICVSVCLCLLCLCVCVTNVYVYSNNSQPLAIFLPLFTIWPSKSNLLGQIYCTFPMEKPLIIYSNIPAFKEWLTSSDTQCTCHSIQCVYFTVVIIYCS